MQHITLINHSSVQSISSHPTVSSSHPRRFFVVVFLVLNKLTMRISNVFNGINFTGDAIRKSMLISRSTIWENVDNNNDEVKKVIRHSKMVKMKLVVFSHISRVNERNRPHGDCRCNSMRGSIFGTVVWCDYVFGFQSNSISILFCFVPNNSTTISTMTMIDYSAQLNLLNGNFFVWFH